MELFDNDAGDRVQRPGLLNDLHEDHGGGNDHNGVNIGEHSLDQVPQRNPPSGHQSSGDGREHHGNADRQLAEEAPQQKHGDHCEEGNQFNTHQDTSMVIVVAGPGQPGPAALSQAHLKALGRTVATSLMASIMSTGMLLLAQTPAIRPSSSPDFTTTA